MSWININYEDIHNVEWEKIKPFDLCEIFKKGEGKICQIYPYNLLEANTNDLHEYDKRCDGKRYFCSGFHDNGYTPKNVIGTCRGWSYKYFLEVVNAILERADKFERI